MSSEAGKTGYKIVRLASGVHSLHSLEYGETLHPAIGPAAEAEALCVRQLRLVERLRQHAGEFVIWDVGLGAAANALAIVRATQKLPCSIRLLSFDCTLEPLRFALAHPETLGYFNGFEPQLRQLADTQHAAFDDGARRLQWDLHLADFPSFLAQPATRQLPKPHAILFDPYSPARNPAMWTLPLFANLFRLLDPERPCALATYSRSTLLRVTLLLAGFFAGIGRASGEKEETTVAANTLELIGEPLDALWLQRVRRSHSAEPLREPVYRQAPLSPGSWELLQRHPQWKAARRRRAS